MMGSGNCDVNENDFSNINSELGILPCGIGVSIMGANKSPPTGPSECKTSCCASKTGGGRKLGRERMTGNTFEIWPTEGVLSRPVIGDGDL